MPERHHQSVLTAYFAQHARGTLADHRPNLAHRCQVPVEFRALVGAGVVSAVMPVPVPLLTLDRGSAAPLAPSVDHLVFPGLFTPGAGLHAWPSLCLGRSASLAGHDAMVMADDRSTSTVQGADHPLPLLRNAPFGCSSARFAAVPVDREPAVIRLVVHGRRGGEIPQCLIRLADDLARLRRAPVEVEALTAAPLATDPQRSYWLLPLLLLPGTHARSDVPQIRERMRQAGGSVTLLPFLGAWPQWWDLLRRWIAALERDGRSAVVVHHPLRPGLADRYLDMLEEKLGCALVAFDAWEEYLQQHPAAWPLPLALAPNRMAEALRQAGGVSSLLDDPQLRAGLVSLLSLLS
jgi:sirohydrochlorin ferrochelatase